MNGKVFINSEGSIFISSEANSVRVYAIENRRTRLVQMIYNISNGELTYANDYIVGIRDFSYRNKEFSVYKADKGKFTFYYSSNTFHKNIKMSPDGRFIIGYNSQTSLTMYINNQSTF